MRKFCFTLFSLTVFALHTGKLWAENPQAEQVHRLTHRIGELDWHNSLYRAHVVSLRDQRPLLIVFGAEWCGFCRKLEKETLARPEVTAHVRSGFVPVHLDLQRDAQIARILNVKQLPSTIILSPQADLLGRHIGFADSATFQRVLQSAQQAQASLENQAIVTAEADERE